MGLEAGGGRLMAILRGSAAKRSAWSRWLGNCSTGRKANPTFYGKTIGGWPDVAVDALLALETALKATGYQATSRWAYNFRKITGSSLPCSCSDARGCSLHAYPIAIDIDPAQNPYTSTAFSWSRTKFTSAQIKAVEAIRNTKGEQVWEWGGRWSSVRDYMHFELQVDPASVAINWSTVQGHSGGGGGGTTPIGDDDMYGLDVGVMGAPVVRGPKVAALQVYLTRVGFDTKGVDGIAGDNTRRALNSWKSAMAITPALSAGEGKIGEWEYGAMLSYSQPSDGGSGTDQVARDAAAKAQSSANAAKSTADAANALAKKNEGRLNNLRNI